MRNNLEQALKHHQAGRLKEAEALYSEILQSQPHDADVLHLLGVVAHQRSQHEAAVEYIDQAIRINPSVADYHNNLGEALRAQSKLNQAIAAYEQALALQPSSADAYNNLGLALEEQSRHAEAITAFQQALRYRRDFETFYHLGNALRNQGNLPEAVGAYRQAIGLNSRFAEAYSNLGATLRQQGYFSDAIAAYRQALALQPDLAEAQYNLGIALEDQGERSQAMAAYRRALVLKPDFIEAYNNLGVALQSEGELTQAIAAHREVLARKPDAMAYNNLGTALVGQGKYEEASLAYREALRLKPDYAEAHSSLLLALNYRADIDPTDLFTEHLRWANQHVMGLQTTARAPNSIVLADRRLHIGYVSPGFTWPFGSFIEPILSHHDRKNFEVFCYSNNVARPDAVTQRLQGLADYWHDIARLDDNHVVEQIRNDGIHILVDLAGHTASNRLLVFTHKPAPIQVAYLGYPNTRGFAAIDYWLSDAVADPPGETERFYVEKVVRLTNGLNCYQPPLPSPPVDVLPALNAGYVTFCSFNNAAKLNDRTIALWSQILTELPEARLILKARSLTDQETQERLQTRFAEHNIPAERIKMISWILSISNHLELYNQVDIALDTVPYNGHTTTCEALWIWMGVPVVTSAGQTHAGRVGVSLLSHVGLPKLIAESPGFAMQRALRKRSRRLIARCGKNTVNKSSSG